jgi:hypothetical protein
LFGQALLFSLLHSYLPLLRLLSSSGPYPCHLLSHFSLIFLLSLRLACLRRVYSAFLLSLERKERESSHFATPFSFILQIYLHLELFEKQSNLRRPLLAVTAIL